MSVSDCVSFQVITFEHLKLATAFSVYTSIFTISRSRSNLSTKVIGSR